MLKMPYVPSVKDEEEEPADKTAIKKKVSPAMEAAIKRRMKLKKPEDEVVNKTKQVGY